MLSVVREGIAGGVEVEHVKFFALVFEEVVHEFDLEGELFMRGGEDGILAEVDFAFVDFEALCSLEDMKSTSFILALLLHQNLKYQR